MKPPSILIIGNPVQSAQCTAIWLVFRTYRIQLNYILSTILSVKYLISILGIKNRIGLPIILINMIQVTTFNAGITTEHG